ncbi:type VI secretion system tube protein Hcp [Pontiellaceae bacterium B12219]|nr:type VI secretion system tube protein Hcp [Pontiellaceae bacterium B12219]
MKFKYRLLILTPLLFALLAPLNAGAAQDMFLEIAGVEGESMDDDHRDDIDVLAWSWGMSQSGTTHVSGGGGAGKASFQDLSITKYVDKSTPKLMTAISNGAHYPEVILTIRKPGEMPLEYYVMTMTDVIVTGLSTGGSGGEDRLTENVTFNFAQVEVEYTPQDESGAPEAPVKFNWDIAANTAF